MTIIRGEFGKTRVSSEKKKEEEVPAPQYTFHVSLSFSEPLIWRRIQVPGELSLQQFHEVLQVCMGWSGEHNHQFYVGKVFYNMDSSESSTGGYVESDFTLHSLEEAIKWCFTYMYDAGDGWEHEIVLEETLPAETQTKFPRVLDGEWAAPPEEMGSVHVYTEYLNAYENPDREKCSHKLQTFVLENFDPYRFDAEVLNKELKRMRVIP